MEYQNFKDFVNTNDIVLLKNLDFGFSIFTKWSKLSNIRNFKGFYRENNDNLHVYNSGEDNSIINIMCSNILKTSDGLLLDDENHQKEIIKIFKDHARNDVDFNVFVFINEGRDE